MKISTADLTAPLPLIEPTFDQATVKPPDSLAYTKEQVTAYQGDPNYLAFDYIKNYVASQGYEIVQSIKDALIGRQQGKKLLSLREADTAARANLNLKSPLVFAAMSTFSDMAAIIMEDIAGPDETVFELRSFYNRGIAYFKSEKCRTDPPERVMNARRAMDDALDMLDFARVPAWQKEIEHGFPVEMCKPDFLTWGQYEERRRTHRHEWSLHDFKTFKQERDEARALEEEPK